MHCEAVLVQVGEAFGQVNFCFGAGDGCDGEGGQGGDDGDRHHQFDQREAGGFVPFTPHHSILTWF